VKNQLRGFSSEAGRGPRKKDANKMPTGYPLIAISITREK